MLKCHLHPRRTRKEKGEKMMPLERGTSIEVNGTETKEEN
jgi:hypothetical protein